MPRSSLWTRWSDLFGLRSLPGSDEESRDFLRKRISVYFRVLFGIYAAIYLMVVVLGAAQGAWRHLISPVRSVHIGVILATLAAWLYTRRRDRTVGQLGIVDALGTTAVGLAAGLFRYLLGNQEPMNDFDLVLFLSQTLLIRGVMVPSAAARTLGLGFLACLPLTLAMAWAAATGPRHGPAPNALAMLEPLTWLTISVLLTGLASRVIYGLRLRVEELVRLGQYTLREKLGEGGMGVVYRATHAMLRRPTALKLLPPDRAGARAIGRFEREVNVTATLTHPNTVAIYDFGRTPEGVFYYVMEYLDGLDLEALVRADGPQPAGRVVHVLKQVAGALAEAHGAGLIHRDIKPANIVLCERGTAGDFAKVLDFGLVRDLSDGARPDLSTADVVQGTPLYMAPESISDPASVDARADGYALGAVGYFLLTGAPVFDAKTLFEVYAQHLYKAPQPPSERVAGLSPKLEALVMACLEKRPEQRPQSAEAILIGLEALDDVPRWTTAEARAWWAGPGRTARGRAPVVDASPHPLAVDLTNRGGLAVSDPGAARGPGLRP